MAIHDRRPRSEHVEEKFGNVHYRALWQSSHWETLTELADKSISKWQLEQNIGDTLDSYAMASLKRDGRIEGLRYFLKEIERLANKD